MAIDFAAIPNRQSWWLPDDRTGERIVFWEMQTPGKNRESIEKRVAAIFAHTEIADPWTKPAGYKPVSIPPYGPIYESPKRFEVDPVEFIRRARLARSTNPEPTASAFAQWVYSLYSTARGDAHDRERGIETERGIAIRLDEFIEADAVDAEKIEQRRAYRRKKLCDLGDELRSQGLAAWELVHCGLHLKDEPTKWFSVTDLCVGDEPLRASPDLLFKNRDSGEVIVVEIKSSSMEIPSNLWPNIWAQLWCYAQIPSVREASRVTVVGEVWGERWIRESRRVSLTYPHLFMRSSVRLDPRAPAFDKFFRKLFTIYAGGLA
ncbi:hypothetical protein [Paraburkholderia sp. J8-2]|uniref:hypothetical protein n=1 Tax=Paraburkholderia sp. J8-2 TaxID=2805440 RepID=UPI002AB5F6BC|nr:hypothetical protein [Paraburkholderia sp. J8-2]